MSVECKELLCGVCDPPSFIQPDAGCSTAQYSDEQPSLSSNAISWFSSSADFPSGDYKIEYLEGAMKYGAGEQWRLNKSNVIGFYVRYNGGSSAIPGPGQDYDSFATQAALEAHNNGQFVIFHHSGGRIGINLIDTDYTTNSGGTQSPLFRLTKICSVPAPPPVCVPEEIGIVTPDIFSGSISWFNSEEEFTAGVYTVSYLAGALRYSLLGLWALNASSTYCFRIAYNNGDSEVEGPKNSYTKFGDQADLEAENYAAGVSFTHTGGKIGVYLDDSPTSDNIPGAPTPTFQLNRTCGGDVVPPIPPEFTCGEDDPTVEGIMCAIQERRYAIVLSEVSWPDRTNAGTEVPALPLTPTPAYPPEGFYSGDSTDAERASQVQAISNVLHDTWLGGYAVNGDWDSENLVSVYYTTTGGAIGSNRNANTLMAGLTVTAMNWEASLATLQGYCCSMQYLCFDSVDALGTGQGIEKITVGGLFYTVGESRADSVAQYNAIPGDISSPVQASCGESTASLVSGYATSGFTCFGAKFGFSIAHVVNGVGAVYYRVIPFSDAVAHLDVAPVSTADSLLHAGVDIPPLAGADFLTDRYGSPDVMAFQLAAPPEPPQNPQVTANGGWLSDKPLLQVFKSNNPTFGHWNYYP